MKESSLLKIALFCSIAGITILFLISTLTEIPTISNINLADLDSTIKIKGTIKSIRNTNTTTFITIKPLESTSITSFNKINTPIKKGDLIEIRGKIDSYKGEKQLIADEVRLIN